ncbi:MAG: hypothetical protein LBE92_00075 [Chryseobacterium sp.]|jgi:hypothetical protein|uniref:hypothetical protein n=1 Tax=Chryseobacterium sp. TaxID=1871047 RepID=UPI0028184194|nr:hypothetical protein [Chryseobacterium sp.]MDR2234493.1 hypothetical protein [Chryseobacterium sp.]
MVEERIIHIPELQYEYYFLEDQWKIVHNGKEWIISIDTFYGYPFYITFENIKTVNNQLIRYADHYNKPLSDIFPVELILKDIIVNQQEYWLNLCVDFINETNCLNENIVKNLIKTKHNKSFSQGLRHKIRKIILLNNYEY